MLLLPGNASHIGRRMQQQDAFALSDFADNDFVTHGGYLALLADGIGGLQHGAKASQLAVRRFMDIYLQKELSQPIPQVLDFALEAANRAVLDTARQLGCVEQMGTTLVAAVVHQGLLYWRAVGDSHLYLCRAGRLSQLNADHNGLSQLQVQVAQGLLSQQQADEHPHRLALEYYVGFDPLPQASCIGQPLSLQPDDRLLLCSDGIDSVLSADQIIDCLEAAPMIAAEKLCDAVLTRNLPYQDNLTAVVLAFAASEGGENLFRKWLRPWRFF